MTVMNSDHSPGLANSTGRKASPEGASAMEGASDEKQSPAFITVNHRPSPASSFFSVFPGWIPETVKLLGRNGVLSFGDQAYEVALMTSSPLKSGTNYQVRWTASLVTIGRLDKTYRS